MKRIAMISEHASPLASLGGVDGGGQNVYVAKLAEKLARKGYLIDVYTRADAVDLETVVESRRGFRVIHVPAGPAMPIKKEKMLGFMDEFSLWMLRFIEREKLHYDLVHAHFFMSSWVAYQLKRWLHVPYIVTFHALGKVRRKYQKGADTFPDERLGIEAVVTMDADGIVAECPQDIADLTDLYHADPIKLTLIPCGYDPLEFRSIPKRLACERLGLDPHKRYVLQLGRMVPRKGVETVIRALSHLHNTVPQLKEVELLVVGGETEKADLNQEPELSRLQLIAEAAGVASSVHFMGKRSREVLKYFYNAADLFITTPWYEPFGITPLEAMACGTPVIGSRVGGIAYSVKDGETGILVPPKNPLAVAHALERLLLNEKELKLFSLQATKRVRQFFTWDRVANEMARLYERIIREHMPLNVQPKQIDVPVKPLFIGVKGGKQERFQEKGLSQERKPGIIESLKAFYSNLWSVLWSM